MKKIILTVIVVGMLGFAMYEFIGSTSDDDQEENGAMITAPTTNNEEEVESFDDIGLGKGETAPDFKLKNLEGETVSLSDYKGKRVLVNFWATWCPPCREEIPDLQKLYDSEDVVILAVNLTDTEENEENIADFVDSYEMTFPVLLDESSDVSSAYQVYAYPTSYMIDSNGHIQFIALGAMDYNLMVKKLNKIE